MILPNSMRMGVCACGEPIEQHQIDPEFLKRRAPGFVDTLRREAAEDQNGNLFIPKHCSSHIARVV